MPRQQSCGGMKAGVWEEVGKTLKLDGNAVGLEPEKHGTSKTTNDQKGGGDKRGQKMRKRTSHTLLWKEQWRRAVPG